MKWHSYLFELEIPVVVVAQEKEGDQVGMGDGTWEPCGSPKEVEDEEWEPCGIGLDCNGSNPL